MAERKTRPDRKKQVAIVIVGIILSVFTITSRSQAHFSLSQTWEVSSTTSYTLQTFQNIKLRLGNVKGLLRVIDKLGGRSSKKRILRLRETLSQDGGPGDPAQGHRAVTCCPHLQRAGGKGPGGTGLRARRPDSNDSSDTSKLP